MKDRPSDAVILERAKTFGNNAMFTVALQHRRLRTHEPEDDVFYFRWQADAQFLVTALSHLRTAVELATQVEDVAESLRNALAIFDKRLPGLRTMRNVGEHFDDYLMGKGRSHKEIRRGALQVASFDGEVFSWLGVTLDIDCALYSAQQLFAELSTGMTLFIEIQNLAEQQSASIEPEEGGDPI